MLVTSIQENTENVYVVVDGLVLVRSMMQKRTVMLLIIVTKNVLILVKEKSKFSPSSVQQASFGEVVAQERVEFGLPVSFKWSSSRTMVLRKLHEICISSI